MKTDLLDIRHCDCMEMMREFPDKHFDLAIVDPPYGINWMEQVKNPNKGKNWRIYETKEWDAKPLDGDYFRELFRVSANQVIWGGNYMIDHLSPTPCLVIWDKEQEFSGADFETAWTSFLSPSKAFRMSRVEAYANQDKIHPTQKPVALYRWLLANYANAGDKILDTHLGSGSSAIACHYAGHHLTACELDADYYTAACERIDRETRQQTLFTETPTQTTTQTELI